MRCHGTAAPPRREGLTLPRPGHLPLAFLPPLPSPQPGAAAAPRNSPPPRPSPHRAAASRRRPAGSPGALWVPRLLSHSLSPSFPSFLLLRALPFPELRFPACPASARRSAGPAVELARVFPGDGGKCWSRRRRGEWEPRFSPPRSRPPDLP